MKLDFNINEVDLEYKPIPDGKYVAEIVATESKLTKKAIASGNSLDGTMLCLQIKIITGKHENRRVFCNINYHNSNEVAQKIGRQRLGEILQAFDLSSVTDSSELLERPLGIQLKTKKGDGTYRDREEVVRFFAAAPPQPAPDPIWDEPAGEVDDSTPF